MPDVRLLMFAEQRFVFVFAENGKKMIELSLLRNLQRNPPFFNGKVLNISYQLVQLATCLLLYFHKMNDAAEKINSDNISGANGILWKIGACLLFYFLFLFFWI